MDLQRIRAKDFCGLELVDLDLTRAKVHVFCGLNRSGKTSIAKAVRWTMTGLCGNMTKKNQAAMLGLRGQLPQAELIIDGEAVGRTISGLAGRESDLLANYGPPEMLGAVVDAFKFISLDPAERAELVRSISADPAKLSALTVELLTKLKLPAADVQAIAGLVGRNLDRAEDYAVQKRRDCKRRLDDIPENAPDSSVDIGGTAFDLEAASITEIEDRAGALRRERKTADDQRVATAEALGRAKQAASPDERNARMKALTAELEALGQCDNKDVEAAEKARAAATKAEADLDAAREQALAAYNQAKGAKEAADARYAAVEKLKGKCPTCGHKMTTEEHDALLSEVKNDGNVAAENMKLAKARGQDNKPKLDAAVAKANQLAEELVAIRAKALKAEGCRLEIAALRQRAAENKDAAEVATLTAKAEALAKTVAELDARLELGAKVQKAKTDYDAALSLFEKRATIEAERDAWDRAQKALGTGGPVRKLAAAGFDIGEVNRHVAALLPGGSVRENNWTLTYTDADRGTRAIESCSRSELFLLGSAFAAQLSKAAGIGLLVLDEADLLVDSTEDEPAEADRLRENFIRWLDAISPDFERILIMATRPNREGLASSDNFAFWWVQNGTAEPVAQAVTA